jgi:hypothetical protein
MVDLFSDETKLKLRVSCGIHGRQADPESHENEFGLSTNAPWRLPYARKQAAAW